ncbi:Phage integrase, site-specific tyrosine recombinase [Pseudomonas chlororaphis subsp. aureofaciens]|uniref:tyrosine-type recombinase/integrase n=1 Tax=Pseudomonas chlororaphis TaxID=587753 RepID=UPI000F57E200|nr:integrase arm-type DNA-binding domain-containing protein [Pseudomonas chlororaphis]AZD86984.1 Phage integrase, site-specific tyrosine recombinase [Pseudomonas chlororaphis subsp. aureofaciens]
MALSDTTIRQAKAAGKAYTLGDTDGLSLAVSPEGNKSWHFRYSWSSKQKRLSLGTYPEISLKEARTRRDVARELVARGINPRKHRNQERRHALLAEDHTFKKVFDQWFEFRKKSLKPGRQSTQEQIQRIFLKDILPALGSQSIYDIRRPDLLDVLEDIERRGAFTTAEKCRTWLHQMFRYALVKVPDLEHSPASDLDVVAAPKPPVKHNPFLRIGELPELLQKLRAYTGLLQTQLGLWLLMLTGVRTGELRLATPDQFHLDQGLWVIPPEVVKQLQLEMRRDGKQSSDIPPYIVPLSQQAQEVVQYLIGQMKPAQKYLLAGRGDLKQRISENTLNNALRRMGYVGLLTGHGIRATISTALNEIGYPKIWVDAQLSHSDPDKVSASYNHAEYVEPRRRMMQDWSDRLNLLEHGLTEAATLSLTIQLDGMPLALPSQITRVGPTSAITPIGLVGPMLGTNNTGDLATSFRLPAVPAPVEPIASVEPELSPIQRERAAMLKVYESPHNLPVITFAKLAGKSRDQVNRDIKAKRLLTLSLGNRGQRIPDWQLDSQCQDLTRMLLKQALDGDCWRVYQALSTPSARLGGLSPVESIATVGLEKAACDAQKTLAVLAA